MVGSIGGSFTGRSVRASASMRGAPRPAPRSGRCAATSPSPRTGCRRRTATARCRANATGCDVARRAVGGDAADVRAVGRRRAGAGSLRRRRRRRSRRRSAGPSILRSASRSCFHTDAPVAAVERLHGALVVGHVDVLAVGREPVQARHVARPVERAARDVEARDAALVGDRAHLLLVDERQRRDVGDALELGRALRIGDGRVPADDAGVACRSRAGARRRCRRTAPPRVDTPPA